MSYQSNLPAVVARLRRARSAGLIAAATVLINAVKRGLQGGYTSGDFVTGASINAVTRSEPDLVNGEILVGTNLMYNLFWELGHFNLFTRRFERVEVWYPAMTSNREQIQAAYARAYAREMAGA